MSKMNIYIKKDYMLKLPVIRLSKKSTRGYTLIEILIVLAITGMMMTIVVYSIIKFRQSIIVSNTAKELTLQLRQARRAAIDNVITSTGYSPSGYYIYIDSNGEYWWGECGQGSGCHTVKSVQSAEYRNAVTIDSASCSSKDVFKFLNVTGDFIITSSGHEGDTTSSVTSCTLTVKSGSGAVSTQRNIIINADERTIKIE
jgi:prepilin-type N-terminal cleavage/methylation domain-containing protein